MILSAIPCTVTLTGGNLFQAGWHTDVGRVLALLQSSVLSSCKCVFIANINVWFSVMSSTLLQPCEVNLSPMYCYLAVRWGSAEIAKLVKVLRAWFDHYKQICNVLQHLQSFFLWSNIYKCISVVKLHYSVNDHYYCKFNLLQIFIYIFKY